MAPHIRPAGGWLLMDRRSSVLDRVTRGDVVVFDAGDGPAVKRIVGVAGDTVSIRAGDVWIARNGGRSERVERSEGVRVSQRTRVFPAADARLAPSERSEVVVAGDMIREVRPSASPASVDLVFGASNDARIKDNGVGEGGVSIGGEHDVSDVRVLVRDVLLPSVDSAFSIIHSLPSDSVAVEVRRSGLTVVRTESGDVRRVNFPGVPLRGITLDTYDGFVRVGIEDGAEIRWLWTEPRDTSQLGASRIGFRVQGGLDSAGPIFVDRDVHYVPTRQQVSGVLNETAVFVPEGYFFLLGDQPGASRDSRDYGCVARSKFVGKLISFLGW